ncbi:MAG: hypothetical protein Q8865_05405 [Bacillota bacterium]|nr:hypothetical protein [Bacillota bacterium]
MPYIEKRIYSGPMLEIERYPASVNGRQIGRSQKGKPSSSAQQNLNDKNAKKKLIRLLNTNFSRNDLFVNLTYGIPPTETKAKRAMTNYLRRVKAYRNRKGLKPLKYLAVTEVAGGRWHHHIVMNCDGLTMDEAEQLWQDGRVNISRLRPDEFGLEGLARYIVKKPSGARRWQQSKNLKKPIFTEPKFIKRLNIYRPPKPPKGYLVVDVETSDNIFTGLYQYITLRKIDAAML